MRYLFNALLFGKSTLVSALLAGTVIGAVALGCTCNQEEGFKWGLKSDETGSKRDTGPEDGDLPLKTDEDRPVETKADASLKEIPDDREMQEIVKSTLLGFDDAVKRANFRDFYDDLSRTWKRQTSPRRLKRLFQKFIDGRADISSIRGMDARLERPRFVKSSGLEFLEVNGSYATSPNPTTFSLKFLPEGSEYKLGGIYVKTTLYTDRGR